jgi:transposase
MGCVDAELLSSLLLLPDDMVIEAVYPTRTHLTVQVACMLKSASCPLCQHASERIHGSYGRTVADVPCGGRRVTLALTVRKFVCRTAECPRKIFTERLPSLVQSYARMTNRLLEALQTIGFATCGEVGERLAPKLGMGVSGPTLLRRMRAISIPPPASVRILGIDDWAWKKGMTYGTILVDLERRCPIELLPDRSTETVETWLRGHPEVVIVSRDRGGEYAAAARKGAPQAQQIADRFHLLKNLRERLKEVMDRKQSCLPEVEENASDAIPAKAQGIKDKSVHEPEAPQAEPEAEKHYRTISSSPYQRPAGMSYDAFQKQVRRDKRSARYAHVRTLFEQGLSQRAIARKLKLSRTTVGKFVQAETYPEMHHSARGGRGSLLDPYKRYLLQRWQQGCRNSVQLYDEITARGFTGSAPLLRMFLAELRKKHQEAGSAAALMLDACTQAIEIPASLSPKPRIPCRMSATRASWLFVSQTGKLDTKQKRHVGQIRAGHPDLETAYQLSQDFVMMLAERREADLDTWLTQAERSGLPEFKKMANGIRHDYAAVKAAFSSAWSQGQVEAQVNCLKLQKRIVFGRANFDLLRLRVLSRV